VTPESLLLTFYKSPAYCLIGILEELTWNLVLI